MKKIAIIGCGSSGLLCAIECAKHNLSVDIYEQNNRCGKKILASGNGRCNITNLNITPKHYYTQNNDFIEKILEKFSYKEIEQYFSELGVVFTKESDGRAFPYSKEAKSIAQLLETYAKKLGVKIYTNTKVTKLESGFILTCDTQRKKYDTVVLSSGSMASKKLGADPSGYELARSLGHTIAPLYPALVQLKSNHKALKNLAGVRLEVELKLFVNGELGKIQRGDLLFTNYGLSGLAVLDISSEASFALNNSDCVEVEADLLYEFSQAKLLHYLQKHQTKTKLPTQVILQNLLPKKLCDIFAPDEQRLYGTKELKRVIYALKHYRFNIDDTKGFEFAEVAGGGVDTKELHPLTCESKIVQNLFITGEVLDVVGQRGGYNFSFAWASGFLAAQAIIKKTKI